MKLFRREPRHECSPPTGVVFNPSWTCPECRTTWRLIEHATYSKWVQDEATTR